MLSFFICVAEELSQCDSDGTEGHSRITLVSWETVFPGKMCSHVLAMLLHWVTGVLHLSGDDGLTIINDFICTANCGTKSVSVIFPHVWTYALALARVAPLLEKDNTVILSVHFPGFLLRFPAGFPVITVCHSSLWLTYLFMSRLGQLEYIKELL